MTNDPEAIRTALVPMGFKFKTEVRPNGRVDYQYLECGGDPESHIDWHLSGGLYEEPLADFLNDKSQTGARMADMFSMDSRWRLEPFNQHWETDRWLAIASRINPKLGEEETISTWGDTPDEAIAALWLKVKGLIDPREVTA